MPDWRDPTEEQKRVRVRSEIDFPNAPASRVDSGHNGILKVMIISVVASALTAFAVARIMTSGQPSFSSMDEELRQSKASLEQTKTDLSDLQGRFAASQVLLKSYEERIAKLEFAASQNSFTDSSEHTPQAMKPQPSKPRKY